MLPGYLQSKSEVFFSS